MAVQRRAHATWEGDLRGGSGRLDLESSGTIHGQQVSFSSRFGDEAGGKTSPEELIAAAHATCLSMALANGLAQQGHPPTRLETEAVCTLDQTRSEEHTSELQSRSDLVCRLLLEKKKMVRARAYSEQQLLASPDFFCIQARSIDRRDTV